MMNSCHQGNILQHKGSKSIYLFLFSLLFVFALGSRSPAGGNDKMEMIVTGQARWSVLGEGGDYFKEEAVSDLEGTGHDQHLTQGPYSGRDQDDIFSHDHQLMEKVRESAMPNRAQKPVYRMP